MPTNRHHVLFFGDQTDNLVCSIRNLYVASKKSGLLAAFLRDASDVCQLEVGNLQKDFLEEVPSTESILEMAEHHAETDGSPALVSSILSYFARLGELILRVEYDPTILSGHRVLIGLCIGLFPAALAATARSDTELARLSLEAFPSYFSWAVATHSRGKRIEWPHGNWSCMISTQSTADVQLLLDEFHTKQDIPIHKRTWIGVIGRDWVAVSGPPSILKLLIRQYPKFNDLPIQLLPVASAVHAPHLPVFSFESTAKPSYIWDLPLQEGACIMSTDDCVPYASKTLGEVTRRIIDAVIQAPLMVEGTFIATAEYLKVACATAAVSIIGSSAQAGCFVRALKETGVPVEILPPPVYTLDFQVRSGSGAVAIVGLSGKFPQAEDLEQFWQNMMEGRTTHERIPRDRFDLDAFYDPQGAGINMMMNTDGCFLSHPGAFDTRLFNMSPREAIHVDPIHRMLLMTSLEALEKAGYNPDRGLPSRNKRTAVYFGQNADIWRETSVEHGIDVFTATGILRAFSPGRVSHHFGFEGGSYSVDSACSSSATAIQLACDSLVNRECDMALAGGAQVVSSPFEFAALGKSGFLAPAGGCKTFRTDADGYCRGEAVGVLVLKRLEDAIVDNDNIDALITGWGRNYSGDSRYMTHPHVDSQEKLIWQVLRRANASPDEIGYVELHGTGTAVGDVAEVELLTRVFGRQVKTNPVHVGSIKANVGHSESAAGVSSVIKSVIMLRHGAIPPQAMISPGTQLHPGFANLDMSSIRIDTKPTVLDSKKPKILVNSFDAAGGNTCLLIERAPEPPQIGLEPDPRSWHIVTVSAQTSESLQSNKKQLLEYLVRNPRTRLSDVAYSTTARRIHYARKSQYTAKSTEQLIEQLQKDILQLNHNITSTVIGPKTMFVFSGQGTSYHGIAQDLYETHPDFRGYLNTLAEACRQLCLDMPCNIINILTRRCPSSEELFNTVEQHLGIVCIQLALAELWKSWGIQPDIVLGHSIGEYAALCVAGVISVSDTIWLVYQRAKLFESTYQDGENGMLSITATEEDILGLLKHVRLEDTCNIACFNGHTSHVVGGPATDLRILETNAKSKRLPTCFLKMAYAVHCKCASRIAAKMEKIASSIVFFPPRIPVASTVTAEIVTNQDTFDAHYIACHTGQPVKFSDSLNSISRFLAQDQAPPVWVEIGPRSTCLNLLRNKFNTSTSQLLPSLNGHHDSWETLTKSLAKAYAAGLQVNWPKFHQPFIKKSLKLLDLPTYAFDLKTFWRSYTTATAAANGINIGDGGCGQRGHKFVPTATIQGIQDQNITPGIIKMTFFSSLSDHRLRDAIKSHKIEGFSVCPAGVYIDMAFTAAAYVHETIQSKKGKAMGSINYLQLKKPFVLQEDTKSQIIETRVSAEEKDKWKINVTFHSRNATGDVDDHGSCQFASEDMLETKLEGKDAVISAQIRIAELISMSSGDEAVVDHLNSRIFYKLYDTIVKYGDRYRNVTRAFIPEKAENIEIHDAMAEVKLIPNPVGEKDAFMLSPYHSDSLVHLAGFVLNIKETDGGDFLHFASGIDSISIFGQLNEKETYVSFVKTYSAPDGTSTADVLIFSEGQLVGIIKGLRFRRIRRDALKAMLCKTEVNGNARPSAPARTQEIQDPRTIAADVKAIPSVNVQCYMGDAFISALIEETGICAGDIEENTNLSELGVDSLMGISILHKMKHNTGKVLPMSIFLECRTIRDVRGYLRHFNDGVSEETDQDEIDPLQHSSQDGKSPVPNNLSLCLVDRYRSKAVLLQGDASSNVCPLIFIAGSSGSASIYANLRSERTIWVLEFPFLHRPSEMKYTPQEIAPIYVAAVKEIRPSGPYLLGGYSAGAVHAYETARLLLSNGDDVKKLILVDMKANKPGESCAEAAQMEDVVSLRNALQTAGILSHAKTMSILTDESENERLFASLRCMHNWSPIPMDPHRRPSKGTVMIWARWGIHQTSACLECGVNPMAADNMDYKSWFYGDRHSYDANGWDTLVGDVETYVVDGNHWSMLEMPCISDVSELINRTIVECLEE